MNLKELLSTTPETLATEQHKALKLHVLEKLAQVSEAIKNENYKFIVEKLVEHSAAGDGYGNENDFIEFGIDGDSMDIVEVTDRLIALNSIANPKLKTKH